MKCIVVVISILSVSHALPKFLSSSPSDLSGFLDSLSQVDWLDFSVQHAPAALDPLRRLACASLDYVGSLYLYTRPEWRAEADKLRKSICDGMTSDQVIDTSLFEDCILSGSGDCWETARIELGAELDSQMDFSTFFNMSKFPKKEVVVSQCLKDDSCPFKSEAKDMLSDWTRLIADCTKDKLELQEAIDFSMPAHSVQGSTSDLDNALTRCLTSNPDPEIKRIAVNRLQNGGVCSEEQISELLAMLDRESESVSPSGASRVPLDVAVEVTRQLLACENSSLVDQLVSNLIRIEDNEYMLNSGLGSALWEAMRAVDAERYLLRRRRSMPTEFENTLHDATSDANLASKFGNSAFVRRYNYNYNNGVQTVIYSAVITIDRPAKTAGNGSEGQLNLTPLTATMTLAETVNYPPMQNKVAFAVEAPAIVAWGLDLLVADLELNLGGDVRELDWYQQMMDALELIQQGGVLPFRFSLVSLTNHLNNKSPQILQLGQSVYVKVGELVASLDDMPEVGRILLDRIGKTDAQVDVHYNWDQEGFTLGLDVTGPAGQPLGLLNATAHLTSDSLNQTGVDFSGSLSLLDGIQEYQLSGFYSPIVSQEIDDAEARYCDATLKLQDITNEEQLFYWETCAKPFFVLDDKNIVSAIRSVYRLLEIPGFLKMNMTFDLGESGILGLMGTPKKFLFDIIHRGNVLADLKIFFESVGVTDYTEDPLPVWKTETKVSLTIPSISDQSASANVISKVYDDQSTRSSFVISTFPRDGASELHEGIFDVTSCNAETEEFLANVMFLQEMPTMTKMCYDAKLTFPRDYGTVNARVDYDMNSGDLNVSYTAETSQPMKISGYAFSDQSEMTTRHVMFEPTSFSFEVTDKEVETKAEVETTAENYVYFNLRSGFAVKLDEITATDIFKPNIYISVMSTVDAYELSQTDKNGSYLVCDIRDRSEEETTSLVRRPMGCEMRTTCGKYVKVEWLDDQLKIAAELRNEDLFRPAVRVNVFPEEGLIDGALWTGEGEGPNANVEFKWADMEQPPSVRVLLDSGEEDLNSTTELCEVLRVGEWPTMQGVLRVDQTTGWHPDSGIGHYSDPVCTESTLEYWSGKMAGLFSTPENDEPSMLHSVYRQARGYLSQFEAQMRKLMEVIPAEILPKFLREYITTEE